MGWMIVAALLGWGVFGVLRARAVVEETWALRPTRSAVGIVAVAIALPFLVFVSCSPFGAAVAGVVLGVALYGGWRLRRV